MLVCSMFVIYIPPTAKVISGLEHFRATKFQASIHTCTDSPEPSLLTCIKYGCRSRLTRAFTANMHNLGRRSRLTRAFTAAQSMAVDQDTDQNFDLHW